MSSRVKCYCGRIINFGSFPNDGVGRLISEEAYDNVVDPFDTSKVQVLFSGGRKIGECSNCGRLLEIGPTGEIVGSYLRED